MKTVESFYLAMKYCELGELGAYIASKAALSEAPGTLTKPLERTVQLEGSY